MVVVSGSGVRLIGGAVGALAERNDGAPVLHEDHGLKLLLQTPLLKLATAAALAILRTEVLAHELLRVQLVPDLNLLGHEDLRVLQSLGDLELQVVLLLPLRVLLVLKTTGCID